MYHDTSAAPNPKATTAHPIVWMAAGAVLGALAVWFAMSVTSAQAQMVPPFVPPQPVIGPPDGVRCIVGGHEAWIIPNGAWPKWVCVGESYDSTMRQTEAIVVMEVK